MKIIDNNTRLIKTEIEPKDFDDVSVQGCTGAHIEMMSDKHLWIGLDNMFDTGMQVIHINVSVKKGKLLVSVRDA